MLPSRSLILKSHRSFCLTYNASLGHLGSRPGALHINQSVRVESDAADAATFVTTFVSQGAQVVKPTFLAFKTEESPINFAKDGSINADEKEMLENCLK